MLTPTLGKDIEDLRPGIQRVRSGAQFIFHKVVEDEGSEFIEVIRLLHGRMDHLKHLE